MATGSHELLYFNFLSSCWSGYVLQCISGDMSGCICLSVHPAVICLCVFRSPLPFLIFSIFSILLFLQVLRSELRRKESRVVQLQDELEAKASASPDSGNCDWDSYDDVRRLNEHEGTFNRYVDSMEMICVTG